MIDTGHLPHDQRGFVHKRIIRAAVGFIPGGSTALSVFSAGRGLLGGGSAPAARAKFTPEQLSGALVHLRHDHNVRTAGHGWLGPELIGAARASVVSGHVPSGLPAGALTLPPATASFTGGRLPTTCKWPMRFDPRTNRCAHFLGTQTGPDPTLEPVGEAVMGRFGPAMVPGHRPIDRDVCPRGMVLGLDRLCYNSRGDNKISNKNRLWPKGRAPLGAPYEMRALSITTRFSSKFKTATKRMEDLGLVKKPKPRARARTSRKQLASGITVIDTE